MLRMGKAKEGGSYIIIEREQKVKNVVIWECDFASAEFGMLDRRQRQHIGSTLYPK